MPVPVIKTPLNENRYKLFQRLRLSVENTIRNYKRDWEKRTEFKNISYELKSLLKLVTPAKITAQDPLGQLVKEDNYWSEKYWMKVIKPELLKNRTWNEYLSKKKGVGVIMAAGLLGYIGDPKRFYKGNRRGLRSLWHYCGLHVKNGKVPSRQRGKKIDWNPHLKALLLDNLAQSFMRMKSPYSKIYYEEKERQLKNGLTKLHAHNRAKRKMIKMFMKDLWNWWCKEF